MKLNNASKREGSRDNLVFNPDTGTGCGAVGGNNGADGGGGDFLSDGGSASGRGVSIC